MYIAGILISPFSYIYSKLFGSSQNSHALSKNELLEKIDRVMMSLKVMKPLPGSSFDYENSCRILHSAQRFADTDLSAKYLTPFVNDIEQTLNQKVMKAAESAFDALAVSHGIEKLRMAIQKKEEEVQDICKSIVLFQMDNQEQYMQVHCTLDSKEGEFFLKPDRSFDPLYPLEPLDLTGYPAVAETKEEFFQILEQQNEYEERLDEAYVRDLFMQPALNTPGDIEVQIGNNSHFLRARIMLDLYREQRLTINHVTIIDKPKGIFVESDSKAIFMAMLSHLHGDFKLTQNICILLTQASLGRPAEFLFSRNSNPLLELMMTGGDYRATHIWVDAAKGLITVQLVILFQIMDIQLNKAISYCALSRRFITPIESMSNGTLAGAYVLDYYSRFFSKRNLALRAISYEYTSF